MMTGHRPYVTTCTEYLKGSLTFAHFKFFPMSYCKICDWSRPSQTNWMLLHRGGQTSSAQQCMCCSAPFQINSSMVESRKQNQVFPQSHTVSTHHTHSTLILTAVCLSLLCPSIHVLNHLSNLGLQGGLEPIPPVTGTDSKKKKKKDGRSHCDVTD